MVEKQYGAVAVLDALGMKGIWQRENPEDIVDTWDYLMKIYQDVHEKRTATKDAYTSKFFTFSDTVIITAVGKDITETLIEFGVDLGIFFTHSILHKFFFRGCVTVGEFYTGEKIVIGKAIDEAAQYHTIPQWVGISTGPSAYNILSESNPQSLLELGYGHVYLPYRIPTKIGLEEGFAINTSWAFDSLADTFKRDLQMDVPNYLEELFKSELNKTSDIDASFKIRNTLEFVKHADNVKREYEKENP